MSAVFPEWRGAPPPPSMRRLSRWWVPFAFSAAAVHNDHIQGSDFLTPCFQGRPCGRQLQVQCLLCSGCRSKLGQQAWRTRLVAPGSFGKITSAAPQWGEWDQHTVCSRHARPWGLGSWLLNVRFEQTLAFDQNFSERLFRLHPKKVRNYRIWSPSQVDN